MSAPRSPAELLASLRSRNLRFAEAQDPSAVLDPAAIAEADALVRATSDAAGRLTDSTVAFEVGILRVHRHMCLEGPAAQRELRWAAFHLVPLAEARPGLLPEEMVGQLRLVGATPVQWHDQAIAAIERFQQVSEPDLLDTAFDLFTDAAEAVGDDDPERAVYLRNRFVTARLKAELTGHASDLDEAIAAGRVAVRTNPGEPMLGGVLGDHLLARFQRTADSADLDEAIDVLWTAAQDARPEDRNRAAIVAGLCSALRDRFARDDVLDDLRAAIGIGSEALAETPVDDRNYAALCATLGTVWLDLFERTDDLSALDNAIELLRHALRQPVVQPAVAINLAAALRGRHERTGDAEALHEAVRLLRGVVVRAGSGQDADDHAAVLVNLCQTLLDLEEAGHDPARLTEATEAARRAMAFTEDSALRVGAMMAASRALGRRFTVSGDETALDEAIELLRAVITANPGGATAHGNLAIDLLRRYEVTGDTVALDEAARLGRRAVELMPPDHPGRANQLNTLGSILRHRAERTGLDTVLRQAVEAFRAAVAATPAGHTDRPGLIRNQANAVVEQFRRTGDPALLDEGIALLRTITELNDPQSASFRNDLAIALRTRFEHTGDPAALDEAVRLFAVASAAAAAADPVRANRLSNLAAALRRQAEVRGDPALLRSAADAYRQAVFATSSSVGNRVEDARIWARVLADIGDTAAALEAYQLAVDLLPQVASGRLVRRDQEHGLRGHAGLPSEAAACAVAAGDAGRAVQLLEQGRGVLIAQDLDSRADVARLRAVRPELAEEVDRLRARRDADTAEPREHPQDWMSTAVLAADRRRADENAWTELVARIRALPGFADFLAAPAVDALLAEAAAGPIVSVNIAEARSDALVLTPDGVLVVPLRQATPDAVAAAADRFHAALAAAGAAGAGERAAQQEISEVLGWLWEAVTGPVLDRIARDRIALDPRRPRIWWSPTGSLAFLPLHAAGHHEERGRPGARTVLDRVISSYTPTVRALRHARARAAVPSPRESLVAVCMPETRGAPDLPYAEREVAGLDATRTLTGSAATRADVLAELPRHAHAHFACHAVVDRNEASASRLLLHDHEANPLTVLALSRLDLRGARLAYLSACRSSFGATYLSDEAIHLTAAFQLAGYPHVVGTLWQINDRVAARMAGAVHAGLRDRSGRVTPQRIARSVHEAVLACRDQYPDTPSLWSAHIHSGA